MGPDVNAGILEVVGGIVLVIVALGVVLVIILAALWRPIAKAMEDTDSGPC